METYASGSRAMQFGTTSSSYGPPTTWANSSPTSLLRLAADIRLEFGRLVSVSPLTTSSFVNGVWSGELTLDGTSSAGVVLQTAAGSATGRSASFELGRLPLAVPVFIAEPSYTAGLSNTVAWQSVAGAGAYLVQQASDSSFSSVLAESGWITGTSHLFAGLADDTTFYYRVKNRRVDDPAVESEWSSFTSSTQDDNVPTLTVSNLTVQGEIQSSRPVISIRASYVDATSPGALICSATVPGILNSTITQQTGEGWTGAWTSQINMPASGSAQATVTATDAVGQTSQLIITLVRLTDANSDSLSDEWQQIPATGDLRRVAEGVFDGGDGVVAVELGDPADADLLRAGGFALVLVGAVAEAFFVHLADHAERAAILLRLALRQNIELAGLGGDEEHGAGVFARGHAGTAADARGGVHRGIGHFFADGQGVRILRRTGAHGDETTGLLDAIKRTTIDDEVFDDGEGLGTEGLDPDGVARAELAHVKLAGRRGLFRAVRHAVDLHGAHAADAFAAVMVEGDRLLAFGNEALVHDVHHFEERGMIRNVRRIDVLEVTGLPAF
jgi:hypothetical protein